jgi:hypothetical protein
MKAFLNLLSHCTFGNTVVSPVLKAFLWLHRTFPMLPMSIGAKKKNTVAMQCSRSNLRLKATVSRDFRPQFFFINRWPLGP